MPLTAREQQRRKGCVMAWQIMKQPNGMYAQFSVKSPTTSPAQHDRGYRVRTRPQDRDLAERLSDVESPFLLQAKDKIAFLHRPPTVGCDRIDDEKGPVLDHA